MLQPVKSLRTMFVSRSYHYVVFSLKIILFYFLLFLCLWPFLGRFLRFSKLYRDDPNNSVNNVIHINSERITEAEDFLNTLNPNHTKQMYMKNTAKSDLQLVIGVVTISRKSLTPHNAYEPQYLTQVMSKLHQVLMENDAIDNVLVFICNVDAHPEKHTEAIFLSKFFPNITRVYDRRSNSLKDAPLRVSRHYNERHDYAFCLQSALDFNPNYIMLVEDDAYPHSDFYPILRNTLQSKIEKRIRRGELVEDPNDWAWLKLNSPYYLNDFHRNNFVICQWVAITCVTSGFVTLAYYLHQTIRALHSPNTYRKERYLLFSCYIIFIISFVFFLQMTWIIGRPYYLKLHRISRLFYYLEPGTSCCTPAVLYPADKLPGIIKFLHGDHLQRIPMDWAMDVYRQEQKLEQYLLTPNIFTHIGFHSTLNGFKKDKSFAYEYFND